MMTSIPNEAFTRRLVFFFVVFARKTHERYERGARGRARGTTHEGATTRGRRDVGRGEMDGRRGGGRGAVTRAKDARGD